MSDVRSQHARALFDSVAHDYDAPAALLSFGRYGRWRRALVSALDIRAGALVLDVATGTGLVARDVLRRADCRVVGLDQSERMLAAAGDRGHGVARVGGSAVALPFPDATFDVVIFTYLLRYVPDPAATLRELARVLRPGGLLGSIEFGVPSSRVARAGWHLYARGVFPVAAFSLGRGWRAVGRFLGPSIIGWSAAWPPERQAVAWGDAGIEDVRMRALTLGAGIVMTGCKRDR